MRLFCFLTALLVSAHLVLGGGTYQRTRDDKTIVWNNAPKEGDTASWNGDRDDESYATGFGTLTWFTADTGLYAIYYGNMIRGKLDGPVNVHSRGKTAYAIFVDGKRSSSWKNGRAPSHHRIAKRMEAVRKRAAKTAKETQGDDGQRSTSNLTSPGTGSAMASAQRPSEEAVVEPSPVTKSESATETAGESKKEAPPEVAGTSQSAATPVGRITSNLQVPAARTDVPRGEGTTEQAPAMPPPAKAESPPPNVAKAEENNPPSTPAASSVAASDQPASTPSEPLPSEYSLEDGVGGDFGPLPDNPFASGPESTSLSGQSAQAETKPSVAPTPKIESSSSGTHSHGGMVGYREEKEQPKPKTPPASPVPKKSEELTSNEASVSVMEKKPDNSVQMVMQPPSSLRRTSEGTEMGSDAQLSREEVIGAADTAARAAGYDLKKYERPKPEYNSASGMWSLVYDHKRGAGDGYAEEPFSVSVDDKSKRASIVAGL